MAKKHVSRKAPLVGFVDLERTFNELSWHAGENEADAIERAFRVGNALKWNDLIAEYRVIILSEAGSGKTEEIREATKRLKAEGKQAFFLRLENITSDFENAFEEGGSLEDFEAWKAGTDEGWIFLDSIDEARLKSFNDFEQAIKKIGKKLAPAFERAHVIVTGRTSAWRPTTDLRICTKHLPKTPIKETEKKTEEIDFEKDNDASSMKTQQTEPKSPFKIVTLGDLDKKQIAKFVSARGVTDVKEFLDAVERADASTYTSRPQDLQELAAFWNDSGRVGSRLELMRNSIARRLDESDKARAEAKPLTAERARLGAQLLAASATLGKQTNIRITDGQENQTGFLARDALKDWDDPSTSTLLMRPIFTQAIYEAVRFHHRSVREFLTAEWIAALLKRDTSRRAIEALIFRNQYGIEIVTPTMRPVLPWLAIMDEKIRERVRKVDPEILMEGGDPSSLPLDLRKSILSAVCEQIASGKERRSTQQRDAVQRLATPELEKDVKALLKKYKGNDELQSFLLRMVWLGEMKACLPEALEIATEPKRSRYTRITAFRAVGAVGSGADMESVRAKFASEAGVLDRECLGELIETLPPTKEGADWLIKCLGKTAALKRHSADRLGLEVTKYVARLPIALVGPLAKKLNGLLSRRPVTERRFCAISEKFGWLMSSAAKAAERLVLEQQPDALNEATLDVLNKIKAARGYQTHEVSQQAIAFADHIPKWEKLNRALFWHDVEASRVRLDKKSERVTDAWPASVFGKFWSFAASDFDYMVEQISSQKHADNKLVALSVAWELFNLRGKTAADRDTLKNAAKGNTELEEKLRKYIRPPRNAQAARYKAMERKWEQQRREDAEKREKNLADSKKYLKDNLPKLKADNAKKPGTYTNQFDYLYHKTRDDGGSTGRWTSYNWKTLIPVYGKDVATFYRDGAVGFWRHNKPKLRSQGYPANETAHTTIFGLTGLEIESHETKGWPENLTAAEVTNACRYASFELNGFPVWLPKMAAAHPKPVTKFLLKELDHELATETPTGDTNYILSDLAWSGQWAWELLGPDVSKRLQASEPKNVKNLTYLLTILQGSEVGDEEIAKLAAAKCAESLPAQHLAIWFAVWAGVSPDDAIKALAEKLEATSDAKERTKFAMHFVTALLGERRRATSGTREAYASPVHLKRLYLMMHDCIRREEDIERAGKGVYSPGLRDNAQEARNSLFDSILKIQGKDSFLAIQEIAEKFPDRPWLTRYAIEKAEREGDLPQWSPESVRAFHDKLERSPTTHAELGDLVVMLFEDLKDDLENGDTSIAKTLRRIDKEPEMRAYLGKDMRDKANGRYSVVQEEELADAKKPDLRFHVSNIDNPVPVELKLADSSSWTGPLLFKHLEDQLRGDYLRDTRSARGLFVLVTRGEKKKWDTPSGKTVDFEGLVAALQAHWNKLAPDHPNVDNITVVGIDLTKRGS